jgi:hypothetical protein
MTKSSKWQRHYPLALSVVGITKPRPHMNCLIDQIYKFHGKICIFDRQPSAIDADIILISPLAEGI